MTDSGRTEPEPIETEFEPAEDAPATVQRRVRPRNAPPAMRSRAVTWPHLIVASGVSAALGATVAIIVSNASSNAPTGTLAREIDALNDQLATLQVRAEQAGVDIVSMRSRLDAHTDRLKRKDEADTALRVDFAALSSQVSAISGAGGDGLAPDGAAPNSSPLGILLARINKLERLVSDATAAPATTREVQRAVADLAQQVAELNLANTTLVTAFDQREATLAALETGVREIAAGRPLPARAPTQPLALAAAIEAPPAMQTATTRAQTIRALSVLDAAVRAGKPFTAEHAALLALLPNDATLLEITGMAEMGAPTLTRLRAEFDTTAARALRHIEEDSDDGWNWLRQSFTGVVSFEPDTRVTQAAETIRSARRRLDIGEIREAVTAVSGLRGRGGAAFDDWRAKALRRAQLDAAMKSLNTRLLGAAAALQGAG